MRHKTGSALVHVMACCLFSAKPLPKIMVTYGQENFSEIWMKIHNFSFMIMQLKMLSVKWWAIFSWGRWINGWFVTYLPMILIPCLCQGPLLWCPGINTMPIFCGFLTHWGENNVNIICLVYDIFKHISLTHWYWDKMSSIFQKTFSNAFSWMEMYKIRLRFHWILFPRVQLTLFQHWFR